MASYAVGDIQGCLDPLKRLLDSVGFDPAGDRGKRFARARAGYAKPVLDAKACAVRGAYEQRCVLVQEAVLERL